MDLAQRLATERRKRLAAERLLELKQAELFAANKKLGQHALQLSHEVTERRAEVAEVRTENKRVTAQLGEATERIQLVEGQLWAALETIRDGFAMFTAEAQLELANPAYLSIFDGLDSIRPGASYDHILTMMVEEGIVDLQGEAGDDWRARMLARWTRDHIPPETIRLWDGRFVKLRDRRTPDGGIVTLGVDITDLMRMWSAVSELPDGFVLYDADDRLLMCNQPYRDYYAASAPAMEPGTSFEDILRYGLERGQYADALGREETWLEERLDAHRRANRELEQQLDDGRWLRIYERETSDGGRVGLRIDITQIKEDQKRLEDAMVRAEAANRAKSAFLANMSHEIRTPMNGVVGMAELLMEAELDEEHRLYVETIRSSGEALLVIINDILDYSKIEADKLVLHPEPFDLERAIHEVLLMLQPTARDKGLSMYVDYDMFLPTRFVGDAGRIRQIVTNLVGNAVKFTNEGHVTVRVVGVNDTENDRSTLHIAVQDSGIGIPPDKVDHVFGEFNQVEDDRNRSFEGTGLGLAITRRLVELMGGEVWVESALGQGSCFGLRIELPTDEPVQFETARLPDHVRHVMVVDEHAANRAILDKQLGIIGLAPTFHQSGDEALHALPGATRPDLLIVDAELPDMTGVDLVARLRERGVPAPAILLTDNPGAVQAGSDALVRAALQKPVPRRTLFATLEEVGQEIADRAPPQEPQDPAAAAPAASAMTSRADAPAPEVSAPAPQSPSADTPDPQHAWQTAQQAAAPAVPDAPPESDMPDSGRLPHVLLAEDNKTNQLVFRKMVAGFEIELEVVNNGLEAVEAFRTRRPDLIFMDISMPKMDGKQATAEIRAIEGDGPHVTIIAVTAHAMSGDRDSIIAAGLDDYVTKPVRKAALAEKLTMYLPQLRTAQAS